MTISTVILTLNEEVSLPGALESLEGLCDDVVVFDSFSDDRTLDVAKQYRVRVVQHPFLDYATQRNAALAVDYRNDWVLMLDADERITPELWQEMLYQVKRAGPKTSLFRIRRKDMFLGRWLRFSSAYPTWFGRLIRLGRVRVSRPVNEQYVTDGDTEYLREHLLHFPFGKGVWRWVDRHNDYSTREARIRLAASPRRFRPLELFSLDPVARRQMQKELAFSIPLRPTLVFIYLYFFRLGFLDGVAGFYYCRLRALYEFLIDVKVKEAVHIADPTRFRRDQS